MMESIKLLPNHPTEKILPFKYPRITSFPFHAHIASIFEAHDEKEKEEKMLPWIYNYYIQLQVRKNSETTGIPLDFCVGVPNGHMKNCPWLVYHGLDRSFVNYKWNSFSEFAIELINFDYYIYLYLDYFYLPLSSAYQRNHLQHDIIIYGYDINNRTFNVADFFKGSGYEFASAKFDDIETAYINYDNGGILEGRWSVVLLKVSEENHINRTIFDVDLMKVLINDYLTGYNSNYRYRYMARFVDDTHAYGIDVYDAFEKHLEILQQTKEYCDHRSFHVLYDHKRVLRFMINYLGQNYLLSNASHYYNEMLNIEADVLKVRNLVLKYNMLSGNAGIITRIIDTLKNIREREESLLKSMLGDIYMSPKLHIPSNTRIDKPYIQFEGQWSAGDWKDMMPESVSSFAQTAFFGDEISFFAEVKQGSGRLGIYIDGEYDSSVDIQKTTDSGGVKEVYKKKLPTGYHVIKVINETTDDGNSQIIFSRFETKNSSVENPIKGGNTVRFMGKDEETKGNWKRRYGSEGYEIIGETDNILPPYVQYTNSGSYVHKWRADLGDKALQKINDDGRVAACMTNDNEVNINIDFVTGGNIERNIAVYFLEHTIRGRETLIECIDGDTNEILHSHILSEYAEGIYMTYQIKGHIIFKLTRLSGMNAIYSGLFWGNSLAE